MSAAALPLAEPLPDGVTPLDCCERLLDLPHLVFFDSAAPDVRLGRYAFVAADPFAWIEQAPGVAEPLAPVEAVLGRCVAEAAPGLPPFQGGAAGLFGYDLARSFERLPAARFDDFPMPALAVGIYDVVLAFDLHRGRGWIVSQGFPELDAGARRDRATARLAQFRELLDRPAPPRCAETLPGGPRITPAALAPQFDVGRAGLTSNLSADGYRRMVRTAVEYIAAGDVFQVNLAQRLLAPAHAPAWPLYRRLRERNPAPYAGFLDLGEAQICSASPECFLTVRDREVETRPIKGTRGRSLRPEADLYAADDLERSEKDRAENVMIVDLMRNDLSRACEASSVRVAQLCRLETYAFVQHLVSAVRGRLRDDCTPLDALRLSFPGGSITGAPKVRAMEIIAELEPTARGAYCGSLAYVGFNGQMDASILIRTITASRGWWQLPVGGGIVAQSNPDDEYRETWHKARGLLQALG